MNLNFVKKAIYYCGNTQLQEYLVIIPLFNWNGNWRERARIHECLSDLRKPNGISVDSRSISISCNSQQGSVFSLYDILQILASQPYDPHKPIHRLVNDFWRIDYFSHTIYDVELPPSIAELIFSQVSNFFREICSQIASDPDLNGNTAFY